MSNELIFYRHIRAWMKVQFGDYNYLNVVKAYEAIIVKREWFTHPFAKEH